MERISSIVERYIALLYVDVVVIFSETAQKHIAHTKIVLTLLKEADVALKHKKCAFPTNRIW